MNLTDILYEAVDALSGAQFAGLIGTDGVPVELVAADDDLPVDLEEIEVELISMASAVGRLSDRLGSGLVQDIVVESEDLTYFTSLVIPGYFAILGVMADTNFSRARFTIDRMVYRIQSEL